MSLFSALGKGIARFANDKRAENQRKKAKKIARKKTGKRIKKAKKSHKYINGSKAYRAELRKENRKISKRHKRIDNFISDL